MSKEQETISMLKSILAKQEEQISELRAEILELRTEDSCDLEPIVFANFLIDEYKESKRENWLDDLCELSDHIMTYVEHHQFDNIEEDEEE